MHFVLFYAFKGDLGKKKVEPASDIPCNAFSNKLFHKFILYSNCYAVFTSCCAE